MAQEGPILTKNQSVALEKKKENLIIPGIYFGLGLFRYSLTAFSLNSLS
jgi:hypothetical protein